MISIFTTRTDTDIITNDVQKVDSDNTRNSNKKASYFKQNGVSLECTFPGSQL